MAVRWGQFLQIGPLADYEPRGGLFGLEALKNLVWEGDEVTDRYLTLTKHGDMLHEGMHDIRSSSRHQMY